MSTAHDRYFHVDAARVLAVSLVTGFHLWRQFGRPQVLLGPFDLLAPFARGFAGVDLFFVISGYAMMITWERSRSLPYRKRLEAFYFNRIGRIYPPYLFALVFWCIVVSWTKRPPTAHDIYMHVAMLHTFDAKTFYSVSGVLWSVAVEMHFYLLFPLLVLAGGRALVLAVVASLVFTTCMLVGVATYKWPSPVATWNVACFLPLFILGMVLYRVKDRIPGPAALMAALSAAILLFLDFEYPTISGVNTAFFGRLAIGASLGIALLAGISERPPRYARPITIVATASYSIYLYNYIFSIAPKPVGAGLGEVLIYSIGVVGFGIVMWLLVERPIELARKRLRPMPSQHVPDLTAARL